MLSGVTKNLGLNRMSNQPLWCECSSTVSLIVLFCLPFHVLPSVLIQAPKDAVIAQHIREKMNLAMDQLHQERGGSVCQIPGIIIETSWHMTLKALSYIPVAIRRQRSIIIRASDRSQCQHPRLELALFRFRLVILCFSCYIVKIFERGI